MFPLNTGVFIIKPMQLLDDVVSQCYFFSSLTLNLNLMKKTLLFLMAGTFLFGSCGEPEISDVSTLQDSQQPSVTFPDILNSRNHSSAGRIEDQLVATR